MPFVYVNVYAYICNNYSKVVVILICESVIDTDLDDYHAYGQDNTVHRTPMTPQRYVRASSTNSLSNSTHTGVSLQSCKYASIVHVAFEGKKSWYNKDSYLILET